MLREEVLKLGRDLLDALETVHASGVIHRDIKPANILLLENRSVLADFGIAKPSPADSDETQTAPGTMVVTPRYMAPEAPAGMAVTPQTDIYAVGIVLFEALTGRCWVGGSNPAETDWSGVPPSLKRILRVALQFDPQDR